MFSIIYCKMTVRITQLKAVTGSIMNGSLANAQAGERHKETCRNVKVD